MRYVKIIFLSFLLYGCAISDVRNEYKGSDAGRVVIGIGATSDTKYSSYALMFRKIGADENNRFIYFQHNSVSAQKRDYDNAKENGVVQSFNMAPGSYEIFNLDIFQNSGTVQKTFKSKVDFSIPFTIQSNQTTYLGNYQAQQLTGENFFGMKIQAGAVFMVSDRLTQDINLVRKRIPNLVIESPKNQTPNIDSINSPFFHQGNQLNDK